MKTNRREFLKHTAAASIAVGTTAAASTSALTATAALTAEDQLPIIDTHQHLWDLGKFRLPWLDTNKELNKSFVTEDYLKATQGLNVVKTVYMEVDVDPRQQTAEARHIIELCKSKDHPTAAAVISGRPNSERFHGYINQFKGSEYVKGVRQVLHPPSTKSGLCLEKTFVQSMKLLGELGMSFDLCMRPTELVDGAKLAELCPQTRFIVDHCGNADPKAFSTSRKSSTEKPTHKADPWRKDIELLAKKPNVICKISGIVVRAFDRDWRPEQLAPIINHCLDAFGPDRVVYGGDWPVCTLKATYRGWVDGLKQVIADRPHAEQKKLLHDNAVKFYGLS